MILLPEGWSARCCSCNVSLLLSKTLWSMENREYQRQEKGFSSENTRFSSGLKCSFRNLKNTDNSHNQVLKMYRLHIICELSIIARIKWIPMKWQCATLVPIAVYGYHEVLYACLLILLWDTASSPPLHSRPILLPLTLTCLRVRGSLTLSY